MKRTWWKEAVMYQIYPRSFNDSNDDGIGDIPGIIEKVPYLKDLGVDIIWLGPVYESPNDDNGYDISDYRRIQADYGTMKDLEELLDLLHQQGMKLIMDLVVNHTSDEHYWFKEARKSKDNKFRDFYIWKDQPNNYLSYFGGSAWEYTKETDQYYLHLFTKKQPDLNWENPKVRGEVYDIMRFWLDKGVDGFRMDVISLISKKTDFANARSQDLNVLITEDYANGPRIHEYLKEMNREVLHDYDVMTVGEGPGITIDHVLDYVGEDREELDMIFQLELMFLDFGPEGKFDYRPFSIKDLKSVFLKWDKAVKAKGWNNIFLDNHDFPRMTSRFGDDENYRIQSAKLLSMLLLTFRGTPCIYQGSEIGMTNVAFDSIEDYDDVETLNMYHKYVGSGLMSEDDFLKIVHIQGRDNARTPMQWNTSPNAGFTKGHPWIKVNPNFKTINVETDRNSKDSIFEFYKKLIALRKASEELVYSDLVEVDAGSDTLFYYQRGSFHIILNMSSGNQVTNIQEQGKMADLVLSNYNDSRLGESQVELRPWEGVILRIKN
jgi:oligo-1,6-glucosidase